MRLKKTSLSAKYTWVFLLLVLLLFSCRNKNYAYRRFNINKIHSHATQPFLFDRVIYCGIINLMATEETGHRTFITDTFYKDTVISYLAKALQKDSLFTVQPFRVYAAPQCVIRDKKFFKPLIDSLSKNDTLVQPYVLPILNFSAFEGVTSPPGQIFYMQNKLTILFCLIDKNGISYLNGQQVYWSRNMFSKNQHVNYKNMELALKRAFKAYHKQMQKSIKSSSAVN